MGSKSKATVALGAAFLLALPAAAQTPPATAPAPDDNGVIDIDVTAKRLDAARSAIQPSLGATTYQFGAKTIDALPQGDQAPLNDVLLRAPGVAQDSFGQIHVRGDHANLQYRLDGVQLPDGLSLFSQTLMTQYANSMSLINGALPAQ